MDGILRRGTDDIEELRYQVEYLCELVLDLLPAPFADILRVAPRAEWSPGSTGTIHSWRSDVVPQVIECTEPLESHRDSRSQRARCPLCKEGPSQGSDEGFTIPEGLTRHLNGSHNFHRCQVMAVAEYLLKKELP